MAWGLAVVLGVALVVVVVVLVRQGRTNRELHEQLDSVRRDVGSGDEERREATRYAALLESSLDAIPQGVLLVDDDGEVVFRNQFAATFESARHADALVEAALAELVADAVENRRGADRTLEQFGPPRRTIVVSVTPLAVERRTFGVLALIEDVTERRRLEAVRRDFVANISHELKTPVGALSLLAETLAAEDDPDVAQRLAGRMQNESERVARTIEDLLELTRIESEEAPRHDPVPVDLLVHEAVTRIFPAAEHLGIDVVPDVIDPRLRVFGDRRQLISALYNLLDNAVKYSETGSSVEVSATTDGTSVTITVSDHGMGIPAKDLDRIFERFYRVDAARSRQTGGTGLGLAIVRHVVANHDGDVAVESRLGEGSEFTLRLPTASGPIVVSVPTAM
jgi:two-component system sensor histidine kinase SenX3